MANVWVASGSSYITAPTLGNLLVLNTVRVVSKNVKISGNDCYWFSQATFSERELAFYISASDDVVVYAGDISSGGTVIGTKLGIFGTSGDIEEGVLDFDIDMGSGAYTLSNESGVLSSGSVVVGSTRNVNDTLFRIGARGSSSAGGDTAGVGIVSLGSKIGDTQVYKDGSLDRNYVMPISGTSVPDTESSQDGTLQNPSGSDWEVLPRRFIMCGGSLAHGLGLNYAKRFPQGVGSVTGDYSGEDYSEDYNT